MMLRELPAEEIGMTIDDFLRLFNEEGPFELIDGERIPKMPTIAEHSDLIGWLIELLFRIKDKAGIVVRPETVYVLSYSSRWVTGSRIPDIAIYSAARMNAYKEADKDWRSKPFVLVPDACIEVISPNDTSTEIDEKITRYLLDGVLLVWVLYPRSRTIHVFTQDSSVIQRLTGDDMLDGGSVIAGFQHKVSEIFAI
jgi:Uma2 family endonuclease